MKGIKELKVRLNEDVEFKKKFCGLKDIDEMLDVARKEGYEVTMDEISCDQELTDDMRVIVAKALCKNLSPEEIHTLVDEIISEYIGED